MAAIPAPISEGSSISEAVPHGAPAPVFVARGLCKTYGSGDAIVFALRNVDLDIYEGEFVVLLGPSGSGKSTLLNILGGLDVPTSGSLSYNGMDLTSADEDQLTRFRRESMPPLLRRGESDRIPPRTCRLRVPILQPDPEPHRA